MTLKKELKMMKEAGLYKKDITIYGMLKRHSIQDIGLSMYILSCKGVDLNGRSN